MRVFYTTVTGIQITGQIRTDGRTWADIDDPCGDPLVSLTLIDHTEGLLYTWMSAILYSGLSSKMRYKG